MTPPKECYIRIAARSGLAINRKLQVGAGVVDPDYTGEIKVILFNHSKKPFVVKPGDKIAQIVVEQAKTPRIQLLMYLKTTKRGAKGFGSTNFIKAPRPKNPKKDPDLKHASSVTNHLIILPKAIERPKGCSFIGSKPSVVTAALGHLEGPKTKVIIDSGSDITLVSQKAIANMKTPPKEHQGKKVTFSQVTAKTSIQSYVDLPLFFETDQGPVQIDVEAYVIKGMTTPLIMGNDFADQYSLSINRKEGKSTLQFAETGQSLKLNNSTSDIHLPREVKAFLVAVKKKRHLMHNRARRKIKTQESLFTVKGDQEIPPFQAKAICINIPWEASQQEIFLKADHFKSKRLAPIHLLDSIISKEQEHITIHNPSDTPIRLLNGERLGKVLDLLVLDEKDNPEFSSEINCFTCFTKAVMQSFKSPSSEKEEQHHAKSQLKQPVGPKTAEVPEFEDIPKESLIAALDINPCLNPRQKKALEKVLIKNHKAFSLDGRIGHYDKLKYEIKLKEGTQPISLPPYHASPEKREAINKQLDKWFKQDVIEKTDSPWGAPVIVVYCFGKPRVCVDYRKVNAISQSDEYPLPRQTDILRALTGSQWLSTFDALSGFHQVKVKEEHQEITAFRCHRGLMKFKRLPFGLRNGPAVFQRVMNDILNEILWEFILVYIDDIIVYSTTFEDHLKHLDSVLEKIAKATITLSPPKCHIGYQSLILLGQKVSRLGISTHKEKVDAIQAVKPPTKIAELQSFLGMVNYFSNYIPFYAWITKPLYSLLRKDTQWDWSEAPARAFKLCKEALTMSPVLGYPISGLGYRLYTDTSNHGIRAILQQVQPIRIKDLRGTKAYIRLKDTFDSKKPLPSLITSIKEENSQIPLSLTWAKNFEETEVWIKRVIAYWSRLFKQAKKNYTITEKEALALKEKEALVKFQPVIKGEEIIAITDHSALTWSRTYQNINRRLTTYGATFSRFNEKLKIVHRAGRVHSNVDPLSRLRRRIPFYNAPHYDNDPQIKLNSSQILDYYEKY